MSLDMERSGLAFVPVAGDAWLLAPRGTQMNILSRSKRRPNGVRPEQSPQAQIWLWRISTFYDGILAMPADIAVKHSLAGASSIT